MERENSELITWSDRLSCGIKLIDDQHKELIALVNEMYNHVTGDEIQEYEYFSKVVHEAIKYVKIHFATEEKIMLAAKIPGYDIHKKAHNSFILAVASNISNYNTGKRFNLFIFTKFLKDWVLSHIALMDKQYFEQIKILPAAKKLMESQCG
jgi:hemerythrin